MELTIKIKDQVMRSAIDYRMDYLFGDFDSDVIKAAGLNRASVAKALFTDEKFMALVAKEISLMLEDGRIDDIVAETTYRPISQMYSQMEAVYDRRARAERAEREAKAEATAIEQATRVLKAAGYRVEKA